MTKNQKGGKKFKRGKKLNIEETSIANIQLAGEGQVYAIVVKRLGGSRLEVNCSDDRTRSAIIPGKFKKRLWMNADDILLVSIEDTSDDKLCYIEHKYRPADVMALRSRGLINFEIDNKDGYDFNDEPEDEQIAPQPDYGVLDAEDSSSVDIDGI